MLTIAIRKVDESVHVDVDSLPAESVEYIVRYGLTQILNDAHASVTDKGRNPYNPDDNKGVSFYDAVMGRVNDRLEGIIEGRVPGARVRAKANPRVAAVRKAVESIGPMTDEDFAKLLGEFIESRKAAAAAVAAE